MSIITRSLLVMDCQVFHFSAEQASLVTSIIEGAVGAIAAGFVLYELRVNERTQSHENDIEEAQFMLEYNQTFIQDEKMVAVESRLEQWMEDQNSNNLIINNDNRQQYVNYLVYLEGMSSLILRGIVNLEHIDDLMAYRFFLALNNPVLQKDQLFKYPDYYRGCFKAFKLWKQYRENNGLPILLSDYSLDLWDEFEYYSSTISIRKCTSNDDIRRIARLIYQTDPYIYPTAFGSAGKAEDTISKLITQKGIFKKDNIYIAITGGSIYGIAAVVDDSGDAFIPKLQSLEDNNAFKDVNEKYFSNLKSYVQDGSVYIACISVDRKMRGKGIGNLLLNRIIKDKQASKVVLEVLSDNVAAINLYKKNGFNIVREEEGYSKKKRKPRCYLMYK